MGGRIEILFVAHPTNPATGEIKSHLDIASLSTTGGNVSSQIAPTCTNAIQKVALATTPSQNVKDNQGTGIKITQNPNNLPTPIKVHVLNEYLHDYPPVSKQYLIEGFTEGFRLLNFSSTPHDRDKNLNTAIKHPQVLDKKLNKELQSGRLMGPFEKSPYHNAVISPLGLQPKKEPGEFRVIHDLSYPPLTSVNDGIPKDLSTVHYYSVADAVKHIVKLGHRAYLAKTDIKSAFRVIPINPKDYHLLGFKWGGAVLL